MASVRRLNVLQDYRPHTSLLLTTPSLTFRSSIICPQSYSLFYMVLRRNSDYLPMQQWLINYETEIHRLYRAVRSKSSNITEVHVLYLAKLRNFVEAQHFKLYKGPVVFKCTLRSSAQLMSLVYIHYLTKLGPWKGEIKQKIKLIRVPYVKYIETNA